MYAAAFVEDKTSAGFEMSARLEGEDQASAGVAQEWTRVD